MSDFGRYSAGLAVAAKSQSVYDVFIAQITNYYIKFSSLSSLLDHGDEYEMNISDTGLKNNSVAELKIDVTALEKVDIALQNSHLIVHLDWLRAIRHYALPNHDWHAHATVEIHFVKEGRVYFCFPNEEHEVVAGQCIFIPANLKHKLVNPSRQVYYRYVFSGAFEPVADDPEGVLIASVLNPSGPAVLDMSPSSMDLLDECLYEAQAKAPGVMTVIESYLWLLFVALTRQFVATEQAGYRVRERQNMDRIRMERIQQVLDRAVDDGLTVSDVARLTNLSTRQLHRIVQAQTGMSTKQVIMQIRLGKAKEYLLDMDLSMETIATMLGFASEQSFSRFFQQLQHESPSKYRNSAVPKANKSRPRP